VKEVVIKDSWITLGQAMKLAGVMTSGIDAKYVIVNGQVLVNGEVEVRRGKKLKDGDWFSFHQEKYRIKSLNPVEGENAQARLGNEYDH
jgi:ribosome-associated protein